MQRMMVSTDDMGSMTLLGDAAIEVEAHRQRLRSVGRTQICRALRETDARAVLRAAEQAPFHLSVNSGVKSLDLSLAELATLQPDQAAKFTALVHAGAANGFQYCFDTYRLSDVVESGLLTAGPLFDLHRALNAQAFLAQCRQLADDDRIAFCDAQVTRYRPGHFLTLHNDDIVGKGRVMAFVLNLTPQWRADWGGLLLFHDINGNIDGGFKPTFNCLNFFKIPCDHSVSLVVPFAPQARYAVTGWARRRS